MLVAIVLYPFNVVNRVVESTELTPKVAKLIELTPNRANSTFETIGVTSLVPNQANQGMTEWIGNKMVNSSQSVLTQPSECGTAQVTHMTLKFKKKINLEI